MKEHGAYRRPKCNSVTRFCFSISTLVQQSFDITFRVFGAYAPRGIVEATNAFSEFHNITRNNWLYAKRNRKRTNRARTVKIAGFEGAARSSRTRFSRLERQSSVGLANWDRVPASKEIQRGGKSIPGFKCETPVVLGVIGYCGLPDDNNRY